MKTITMCLLLSILLYSCKELPKQPKRSITNTTQSIHAKNQNQKVEYTILVGKLMDQEYVPDIQPVGCFENDIICRNSFYLYKINIQQVISGEPLRGIIKVARYQHARYMYKGSDNAVFIIEKIANEKTRQLLKTDYFITEYVTPKNTYCFPDKFDRYLPEIKDVINSNCLFQNDVYGELKDSLIELVDHKVKKQLRKQEILINHDNDISDGINLYTEFLDDEDNCGEYIDLEKLNADKNCNYGDEDEVYKVFIYEVSKSKASSVKELILGELSKTKINFDNIKMNFQIIDAEDESTLYWHYKIEYLK